MGVSTAATASLFYDLVGVDEQRRCSAWLLHFTQNNQPKFLVELRHAAMREVKVSKNSFDAAWVMAIDDAGPP